MSRYVENPKPVPSEKACAGCERVLPGEAFARYRYTTGQGKHSLRVDSRCKECRNAARRARRALPDVKKREVVARKAWREANRERRKAYEDSFRQSPKGRRIKAKHQRIRKMRIKAEANDLSEDQRQAIAEIYDRATLLQQKLRDCVVCDDDLELQVHVDHIIPLSRGGRHVPENLQLLSGRENLEKGVSLCLGM